MSTVQPKLRRFPLRRLTAGRLRRPAAAMVAGALVVAEQQGLGIGYVRDLPLRLAAVDEAQAKAAAKDYLHPDTLLVVIVGKGDAIEPQLARSGVQFERINFKAPIDAAGRAAAKKPPPAPAPPARRCRSAASPSSSRN